MIVPVIMAGGSGSRLWPMSRQQFPKQFLSLTKDASMLQETLSRISSLKHAAPTIICNESHRFIVAEQLRNHCIHDPNILLEPEGKNTAPAIALAAFDAQNESEDPILLVLAADHTIENEKKFCSVVQQGIALAQKGKLVTFGIVPNSPETGYGYIQCGGLLADGPGYHVSEFVEKPNLETAEEYLKSGRYLWNSGIFIFKASRFLEELKKHQPDIYTSCKKAISQSIKDLDFVRVNKAAFQLCPENSIDYAVMEKTDDAVVIPADIGWSDVGSWSALWDISEKDDNANVIKGDVLALGCSNSYFYTEDKLVASIGLDDVVVIDTKDATLVAKKSDVQKIKDIVTQLRLDNRSEWLHHREVYRPWGHYDSLDSGQRFQVKRITVKPGEKLSMQLHHHRAEHWVVVSGTAKVSIHDKEFLLTENQSTHIPIGTKHSLENPGKVPLEIIEVQSGTYLSEDDIVRFEDNYGRT